MQKVQFEYFYNDDSDQYSFYRIPKLLFTEEYFSSLSCEAKVLYGLMLDRISLSLKNKWFDEQNRAYIIFTIEDVMELLNCKSQKAVKIMKELDAEDGIGLIEKIRQGFGKPNIIYVKNFMIKEAEEQQQQVQQNELPKNCENQNSVIQNPADFSTTVDGENQNSVMRKSADFSIVDSENQNSVMGKPADFSTVDGENQNSVMRNPADFSTVDSENQNSVIVKIKNQECRKSKPNYTDYSKTDISKNNPIYLSKTGLMDEMDTYKNVVKKNINYTCFENDWSYDIKMIDELIDLIVEIMTLPDAVTVRIGGVEKKAALVKSQFMKLKKAHIEYVMNCLKKNTTKIANIRAYLLTTLYNAPLTMDSYYQAKVNYDLYGNS
ncbi:hypothetical protein DW955_12220 [Ruminococcus sp. AM45-9BH]|jgi:hypothetical protein|nr:hypothetical protein DW225_02525 [Ruminococcus sp. AM18-44]RHO28252.1 hypothetical protein DW217_00530 [Ruminococcus sp. AM18-15]RHS61090.1 hypothetical protein DW955_12220 [Ruminococcus sp. AM45-9BH]